MNRDSYTLRHKNDGDYEVVSVHTGSVRGLLESTEYPDTPDQKWRMTDSKGRHYYGRTRWAAVEAWYTAIVDAAQPTHQATDETSQVMAFYYCVLNVAVSEQRNDNNMTVIEADNPAKPIYHLIQTLADNYPEREKLKASATVRECRGSTVWAPDELPDGHGFSLHLKWNDAASVLDELDRLWGVWA